MTTPAARPDWVAVDWGTTRLRAWAMSGETVLDRRDSADGMGRLSPDGFEPALLALIGDWLGRGPLPVLACGMVGARQGWTEAPYVSVPCTPPRDGVPAPALDPRLDVKILPGVSQARPADVMRGEETQVAGFLAREPKFDGILCLPGTHTKWVHVSAAEIVSFRSFMTGEMFDLLTRQSVLRFSVAEGWDAAAFLAGVADGMGRPAGFAAELFTLRAGDLLGDPAAGVARARLSGLLIGLELAAARPYWLGQDVVVLGDGEQAQGYVDALAAQGAMVRQSPAEDVTLSGLIAARAAMNATD